MWQYANSCFCREQSSWWRWAGWLLSDDDMPCCSLSLFFSSSPNAWSCITHTHTHKHQVWTSTDSLVLQTCDLPSGLIRESKHIWNMKRFQVFYSQRELSLEMVCVCVFSKLWFVSSWLWKLQKRLVCCVSSEPESGLIKLLLLFWVAQNPCLSCTKLL